MCIHMRLTGSLKNPYQDKVYLQIGLNTRQYCICFNGKFSRS